MKILEKRFHFVDYLSIDLTLNNMIHHLIGLYHQPATNK